MKRFMKQNLPLLVAVTMMLMVASLILMRHMRGISPTDATPPTDTGVIDPHQKRVLEYHADGTTAKQITYSDDNGRTYFEFYRPDRTKLFVKTVFAEWEDDERYHHPKSQRLAWTEDDYDVAGESTETRWYHPGAKMYMKSETLGKDQYRTTTYRSDGKIKSVSKSEPGMPRTYTYYRKDGKTIWYTQTIGENGAPGICRVFFDWKGNACDWTFTREHLWKSGDGISPGDPPSAHNRDNYTRQDGTLAFRQTWYSIWPDARTEPDMALGEIEIFDLAGKTRVKRVRLVPNRFDSKPILRDVEIFHADGSRTLRTYGVEGKPEKEETFSAQGELKSGKMFGPNDQFDENLDAIFFDGFGVGFRVDEFFEI